MPTNTTKKNNQIHLRNNKRWTDKEDNRLVKLYNIHKSFKPIAVDLQRSVDAVQARYVKVELCNKFNKHYLYARRSHFAKSYHIDIDDFVRYLKYAGIKGKTDNKNVVQRVTSRVTYTTELPDSDDSNDSNESNESDDSDESDDCNDPDYICESSSDSSSEYDSDCSDNSDIDDVKNNHVNEIEDSCDDSDDSDNSNNSDDSNDSDDQLYKHIIEKRKHVKLNSKNIKSIMKYMRVLNMKLDKLMKQKRR